MVKFGVNDCINVEFDNWTEYGIDIWLAVKLEVVEMILVLVAFFVIRSFYFT